MCLDTWGYAELCPDEWGCVQMSQMCRCVEMCVDGTLCVWKSLEVSGEVCRYVWMGRGGCKCV